MRCWHQQSLGPAALLVYAAPTTLSEINAQPENQLVKRKTDNYSHRIKLNAGTDNPLTQAEQRSGLYNINLI